MMTNAMKFGAKTYLRLCPASAIAPSIDPIFIVPITMRDELDTDVIVQDNPCADALSLLTTHTRQQAPYG